MWLVEKVEMNKKGRFGRSKVVNTFMSSVNDHRTKLQASLIRMFPAEYGQSLVFQRENDAIIVTTNITHSRNLLFQISVDVENRARLTETNLKQLGADYGDKLEFTFIDEGKAIVRVHKQQGVPVLPEEVEE